MRLVDLEATFLKITSPTTFQRTGAVRGDADGVWFLCPKCFAANKGPVGTHAVLCWFHGVDPNMNPKPGRWTPTGTTLDDLTFVPAHGRTASVLLNGGCGWHGFVKNGDAA